MSDMLFDRISRLMAELSAEKRAAGEDPGTYDGESSHVTADTEDPGLREVETGEYEEENSRLLREMVDSSVESQPDATPRNIPTVEEHQETTALPTGEDPANEKVTKGKPEGDVEDDGQGGTSHPARGDFGEKYSATKFASMSDTELLRQIAELGNMLAADIATGAVQAPARRQKYAASQPSGVDLSADDLATLTVASLCKMAEHQADLTAEYLATQAVLLKLAAEEAEEAEAPEEAADIDPEQLDALADLLQSEDISGVEESSPDLSDAELQVLEELAQSGALDDVLATNEAAEDAGEAVLDSANVADEEPSDTGEGAEEESSPEDGAAAIEDMSDDEAIQQLAMSLLELGIEPEQLAEAAQETGQKMAAAVMHHKLSGKFRITEAKTAREKAAREYMKAYIRELLAQS